MIARDAPGDVGIREWRKLSVRIIRRPRFDGGQLCGESFGDLRACRGVHTPDALTHDRPELSAIEAAITSMYCSQLSASSSPSDDLAEAWTMHFDARVVGPDFCGRHVAEHHAAPGAAQNLGRRRRDRTDSNGTLLAALRP